MADNEKYNFEYFILNESFRNWASGNAHDDEVLFWQDFLKNNPDQKEEVIKAKLFLLTVQRSNDRPDQSQIENSWKELKNKIEQEDSVAIDKPISSNSSRVSKQFSLVFKFAASFALLIISIFLIYKTVFQETDNDWTVYKTEFNELKNVSLPDGTVIQMNANTQLKFKEKEFNRQLILSKGEAFFQVNKTEHDELFKILTNDLNIEVLGTEFNVNIRNEETKVALKEGKVKLLLPTGKVVFMRPGELAILDSFDSLRVKEVNISIHEAWRDKKVIFDNTSLKEVVELIEVHYGVHVILDKSIQDKTLSGEIPNDNLKLLLETLEIIHDLDITYKDNYVKISE